jgi:hypothetical protein
LLAGCEFSGHVASGGDEVLWPLSARRVSLGMCCEWWPVMARRLRGFVARHAGHLRRSLGK